jgi:hypothetical protein
LNALNTPLQADGLSRRVYPFIGLAIVGLVSLHGSSGVTASPVLAGAAWPQGWTTNSQNRSSCT